eukprot:12368_1
MSELLAHISGGTTGDPSTKLPPGIHFKTGTSEIEKVVRWRRNRCSSEKDDYTRSEAPTSFRKNTLGVPGSLKKKPSPRSSPLPNNRSKRTPGKEKVPKNRVPNRTAKVTGHLKEKTRPKVEPEDSQNSGSDSDSVWADMISAVDDAEESGSLTDNEATKIVQFILGRDEAIKDVFLSSRGNSNSAGRFIKNAKRRLNVA